MSAAHRVSNKSTYTSLAKYFRFREGRGKGVMLEAFLSYWLSRFILLNGPKDGINPYVFPLAVCLAKGKRLSP